MRAGPKAEVVAGPLDLRRLPKGGGDRVVAFVEEYCRVTRGTGAKEPLRLRPFQQQLVHGLFDDPRPRQGLLSVPRANGKTSLASALGLYGLFADGVEGAEVLVVASDERQARIAFNIARRMVQLESRLDDRCQIFQDRLYVPHTDSVLRPLPAEPGALLGYNPSLLIVDELAVVTQDVWEACSSAAGKRDRSLTLAISTPAAVSESVMWDLVVHGRAGDDDSFFFEEFSAPEGCDIDDEAAWYAANPALSDFLALDAMRSVRKTLRESTFRRLRLGQWLDADESSWLPEGAFAACADPSRSLSPGDAIVVGFDGSDRLDSSVLVACTIGEPFLELLHIWEDQEVPILDVEDAIRSVCERFDVKAVVCDPFRWRRSMQILLKAGLPVEEYPQAPARMVPATAQLYQAIMNGKVSHSGDPRLARHFANAHVRVDARGTQVRKETKHSTRRIDAAVAAIMAYDVAANFEPPKEMIPLIGVTY
jgi:phage terminase large subunit-like protein